jgi:hypothetical protein
MAQLDQYFPGYRQAERDRFPMMPSESRSPAFRGYSHRLRVAIAGGGIGGMALALSLHDAGFRNVDVYESASSVKELGVGINVLPHATRELTELGLLDELAAVGIPTAELTYYSKHGQPIWSEPRGIAAGYRPPLGALRPGCGRRVGRVRGPRQRCSALAR